MSWRLVYASAVGTSHISADLPCQDACQMQVAWLNDQQPLLVMFLADGAGSVSQGGDGGVVVDFGHGLQLPLTPMVGEYANMTHFITDEDAVSRLETFTSTERVHKVAAFTDGIQRLALNMLDNSPHVPFFTPFFNGLASATQEQLDLLPELLKQFLSSPAVNERTDDDKTLALALWLP
ncbi:protein phosphatase 2C domain-containing protein [Escherichia coli]|nr:protein phosphatase 2C domain-containing protein [Escherichia coli]